MGMLDSVKAMFTTRRERTPLPPEKQKEITDEYIREETRRNIDHLEQRLEALRLIRERV